MRTSVIRTQADLRSIESKPYSSFMPFDGVLQALEHTASEHRDKRALTFIETSAPNSAVQSWTYAELLGQVRRAARAFAALVPFDTPRVAFMLPPIPQAYVTLLAAEAVGVACPINYLLGPAHVAELINAANANIVVALGPSSELDIWSKIPGLQDQCPGLRYCIAVKAGDTGALDFDTLLQAQTDDPILIPITDPDALAALFHTGGTTGRPKLVQHTQRNQLHAAWGAACMYGLDEKDVILNGFPLFHVAGAFVYGLSVLLAGGEVILPTLLGLRNSDFMANYWSHVERHRVTILATVPTVISAVLALPRTRADLSRVRCLLTGGSPLPNKLADAFEAKYGIPVRNILGMTECGGVIAVEPMAMSRMPGSVGLPLPYTSVTLDPDGLGNSTNEGTLRIRGPNVSPGYTDPKNDLGTFEDGWLLTGDIGHIDESGRIFVTARAKDLIIRSGHNIDPIIIEDALMKHPDVLMAAAVGAPDEYAGELPVAYVVLREGCETTADDVDAFGQKTIAERPAFPKAIFVVDELPMTAIGKVFKPELRAQAIRWALESRLAKHALSDRVEIRIQPTSKGVSVSMFAEDDATVAAINDIMAPLSLNYQLSTRGS